MPVLTNAKHERFTQELAKGKTQIEAYTLAGYRPDDGAANRLSGNIRVKKRLAELLERAAAKTEITVASITERLLAIAAKGEASPDAPMLSVGRAALMDAAKLNGLIVEKVQADVVQHDVSSKPLTEAEWFSLTPVSQTAGHA